MSLARYLPRTRESAEEMKARAYREYGIAVIDIEREQMPWEFKAWLKQWAENRFGPRRAAQ